MPISNNSREDEDESMYEHLKRVNGNSAHDNSKEEDDNSKHESFYGHLLIRVKTYGLDSTDSSNIGNNRMLVKKGNIKSNKKQGSDDSKNDITTVLPVWSRRNLQQQEEQQKSSMTSDFKEDTMTGADKNGLDQLKRAKGRRVAKETNNNQYIPN